MTRLPAGRYFPRWATLRSFPAAILLMVVGACQEEHARGRARWFPENKGRMFGHRDLDPPHLATGVSMTKASQRVGT